MCFGQGVPASAKTDSASDGSPKKMRRPEERRHRRSTSVKTSLYGNEQNVLLFRTLSFLALLAIVVRYHFQLSIIVPSKVFYHCNISGNEKRASKKTSEDSTMHLAGLYMRRAISELVKLLVLETFALATRQRRRL
jgi:hypothetical protein